MPREHRLDRCRVTLRQPQALRVFVSDEHVAVAIGAAEQNNGVVGKAVVKRGPPFPATAIIEFSDDMNLASERREELAGGNVPITIEPSTLLPTREVGQNLRVFGIVEAVV